MLDFVSDFSRFAAVPKRPLRLSLAILAVATNFHGFFSRVAMTASPHHTYRASVGSGSQLRQMLGLAGNTTIRSQIDDRGPDA